MSQINRLLNKNLQVDEKLIFSLRECQVESDFIAAYMVLHQLQSDLLMAHYLARVEHARNGGWRLFVVLRAEEPIAAIGFRLLDDLAWGRSLLIEQIVVDSALRGRGIGTSLMLRMAELGRLTRSDHIRLSAGLNHPDLHRFVERIGMRKTNLIFAWVLD